MSRRGQAIQQVEVTENPFVVKGKDPGVWRTEQVVDGEDARCIVQREGAFAQDPPLGDVIQENATGQSPESRGSHPKMTLRSPGDGFGVLPEFAQRDGRTAIGGVQR